MFSKKYNRIKRISQEIKRKISFIVQNKIQDKRIGMITVSDIKLSNDLMYAKIFFTLLNNTPEHIKTSIKKFKNSHFMIRKILSKSMKIRTIPSLIFIYDNSLVEGIRINNLIHIKTENHTRLY